MPKLEIRLDNLDLPDEKKMRKIFNDVRREYLTEAASILRRNVLSAVVSSGVRTKSGKILSWQRSYRKKGYVAVRPKNTPVGKDSPAAVTHYVDQGHGVRKAMGKSARYQSRAKMSFVSGRKFYETAEDYAAALAERFSEEIPEEIKARLEAL